MIEEAAKELLTAMRDLDFKMRKLRLFISFFPIPTSLATHPAVVVEEEIKVTKEYYEARDRYFSTRKQFRAVQAATKQTY